jgi:hypothetical protein
MSSSQEPPTPQNLVIDIQSHEIHLDHISNQMFDAVKGIGAFQKQIAGELAWLIYCASDDELTEKLDKLNRLGFLFVGEPAGWPPAEYFDYFRKKKLIKGNFKEVRWRGPGDWFIIER